MFDAIQSIAPLHGWFLVGLVVLLLVVTEIGFRLGARRRKRPKGAGRFHGGEVLSALMVLLSFFLGFSFQAAYEHFEKRREYVLEEANAIETAYLRSLYLPEPQRAEIGALLRRYVDVQIEYGDPREYRGSVEESERLERALWQQAAKLEARRDNPIFAAMFVDSLTEMFDLREDRTRAVVYQRLPATILLVAVGLQILAVLFLGYNIGVAGERDAMGIFVVILSLAVYLVLIVDLDHPYQRAFEVNQQALQDARQTMGADVRE